MSNPDFSLLSIVELAGEMKKRSLSPVHLVDAYLARIEKLDSRVASYLTLTADLARAQASRAEQEIVRGEYRGPLHGIPVALKDLFDTAGIRTTANSRIFLDRVPEQDATVTARLTNAGAILLGKLKMYEFAMGIPQPDDPFPPARNPWELDHIPGGSSSGSGAALAAYLCAGSFGSDTGGSIRHPAAMSGIVGLKPTYGLVSRRGVIPLSWSLDHVGPMARTVEDVAILLQAVAGYDPGDPTSVQASIPNYTAGLAGPVGGTRIGVPERFIEATPGLQPDVLRAFKAALKQLQDLGLQVVPIELPAVEHAEAIFLPILLSEAIAYHEVWLRNRKSEYGRGFWKRLVPGFSFTGAEYVQAQRGRSLLCREFEGILSKVDLIATPTVRETAPTLLEHMGSAPPPRGPFTGLFNLTGQPSISIPCGFDGQGLPIGLMLSGRAFEEVTLLRAANAYQGATEWHLRVPPIVV